MAIKKDIRITVKAVCLNDCSYGTHGQVVSVSPVEASGCVHLDTAPAAVAYAEKVLAESAPANTTPAA